MILQQKPQSILLIKICKHSTNLKSFNKSSKVKLGKKQKYFEPIVEENLFQMEFNICCEKNGIRHQFTHARSPIHNDVGKQKNHSIL